jgi:hypothetical protein
MAGALAFVSPWGVLAAVVVAAALLFWPVTNTSGELGRIDTLLQTEARTEQLQIN